MSSYVCGIDTGVTGAMALIDIVTGEYKVFDIPNYVEVINNKKKKRVDARRLHLLLKEWGDEISFMVIEKVHSSPQQGVASAFAFGQSYGTVQGCVAAVQCDGMFVIPQVWKKHFGLIGRDKNASLELARYYWGDKHLKLVKHHNRADALLIAQYGVELFQKTD